MQQPGAHTRDEHRLFVYGTLMRGQPNARQLVAAAFIGRAQTVAAFTLIWWQGYPGLRRGGSTSVRGELYQVSPALLVALDEFEGHPTLFQRDRILLSGGAAAQAYLVPRGAGLSAAVIASGDWRTAGPRR
jgi:gamma-glutamylaminecyclotransferase